MGTGGIRWIGDASAALERTAAEVAARNPAAGIVAQEPNGTIVGANEIATEVLGLSWDQMVGRTSMDPRWSAVSETGLPLVGEQHPAMVTLATGQPVTGFLMGVMTPIDVGEIGRTLSRTRWIEIASHPAVSEDGDVVGVVASFVDASETPRGRAASDAQWAAFHLVVQNTDDVLVRTDADGDVQWASLSSSRVLGWAPDELVRRGLPGLVHPDDRPRLEDLREAIRSQGSTDGAVHAEMRVAVPGSGWRWVSDAARALRDRELGLSGELHALRDIDAEVAARAALADSERRYRLIAENASDVIVRFRDGVVVWVSPSVSRTLGGDPDAWVGRRARSMIDEGDVARVEEQVAALHRDDSRVLRLRVKAGGGSVHWVDAHISIYLDDDDVPDGYIASLRLVDDLVRAEGELQRQARLDAVTGLANRTRMMEIVAGLIKDERRQGRSVAMLFCDLDEFKTINDRRGHGAGDEVLQIAGRRISDALRRGDAVGRIGGDEFLVVLLGVRGLDEAMAVAEKVRVAVMEPMAIDDGVVEVTVSIGVTLVRPGDSGDALVDRADSAMYAAKRGGRNRVVAV